MTSSAILYSQPQSKVDRRSRQAEEGEELGKKPKKVNSEARKQQNRIASRNYREKRKRKLQYLQQLIKDESNDEQTPETSPQQHEAHLRLSSTDYEAGSSLSPFTLSSHNGFAPLNLNDSPAHGSASAASTSLFDNPLQPTTHAYSQYESSWNAPVYDPPPSANMTWNVPAWMPSIDYSPRMAPREGNFHFSPPLGVSQPVFEQTPSPYHHPRQLVPNAEHYALGSPYENYNGSQSQTPGIPSVSLPAPSSYLHGHYSGSH